MESQDSIEDILRSAASECKKGEASKEDLVSYFVDDISYLIFMCFLTRLLENRRKNQPSWSISNVVSFTDNTSELVRGKEWGESTRLPVYIGLEDQYGLTFYSSSLIDPDAVERQIIERGRLAARASMSPDAPVQVAAGIENELSEVIRTLLNTFRKADTRPGFIVNEDVRGMLRLAVEHRDGIRATVDTMLSKSGFSSYECQLNCYKPTLIEKMTLRTSPCWHLFLSVRE